jgi:hypothetical protein
MVTAIIVIYECACVMLLQCNANEFLKTVIRRNSCILNQSLAYNVTFLSRGGFYYFYNTLLLSRLLLKMLIVLKALFACVTFVWKYNSLSY